MRREAHATKQSLEEEVELFGGSFVERRYGTERLSWRAVVWNQGIQESPMPL